MSYEHTSASLPPSYYLEHVNRVEEQVSQRMSDLVSRIEADNTFLHTRVSKVEENLTRKIEENSDRVLSRIDRMSDQVDVKFLQLDTRITALERWRWFIVGGATVAFFVFTNILRISEALMSFLGLLVRK